ncbi:MAG: LysR family transcriptional regulator [Lysobacteraceae bacterium]|nr:LysR family transcriptional regulator [Silanimonas sp.]
MNAGGLDLNDLKLFALVVEHGGYAAAERASGVPKSRLSRRIAQLEQDFGVRLIQRSTRKFAVTEVGLNVHRHAQAMLAQAQAAAEAVQVLSAEPRGVVRLSCPVSLSQRLLSRVVPGFLIQHPKVRLQVHVANRRVDVIEEGFDVALRVRTRLDTDGELAMRRFGEFRELLVASPIYLARHGRPVDPEALADHVTLSMREDEARQTWELHGPGGEVRKVEIKPRLMALDFPLLLEAATAGIGIALVPEAVCVDAVRAGRLEVVMPDWSLQQGIFHAVFPSRRGQLPAVRALIDHMAAEFPRLMVESRL